MIDSAKVETRTKSFLEAIPKVWYEMRVSVQHHKGSNAMKSDNFFDKQSG